MGARTILIQQQGSLRHHGIAAYFPHTPQCHPGEVQVVGRGQRPLSLAEILLEAPRGFPPQENAPSCQSAEWQRVGVSLPRQDPTELTLGWAISGS